MVLQDDNDRQHKLSACLSTAGSYALSVVLLAGPNAQALRLPTQSAPTSLEVVPAQLSLQHTVVASPPTALVAGRRAEFTIHPVDQYGNRGASGQLSTRIVAHWPTLMPVCMGNRQLLTHGMRTSQRSLCVLKLFHALCSRRQLWGGTGRWG